MIKYKDFTTKNSKIDNNFRESVKNRAKFCRVVKAKEKKKGGQLFRDVFNPAVKRSQSLQEFVL